MTNADEVDEKPNWRRDYPVAVLLLFVYLGLFAAMAYIQGGLAPGRHWIRFGAIQTPYLVQFGAIDSRLMADGQQYWRLLTATLLHESVPHLVCNALNLFFLGRIIETWYGAGVLLALHVGTGAGANVLSVWKHAADARFVQVGASGALFGFLGFLLVVSLHGKSANDRWMRSMLSVFLLVNIAFTHLLGADMTAHLGGAFLGMLAGLFEFALRPGIFPDILRRLLAVGSVASLVGVYYCDFQWQRKEAERKAAIRAAESQRMTLSADRYLSNFFRIVDAGLTRQGESAHRKSILDSLTEIERRLPAGVQRDIIGELKTLFSAETESASDRADRQRRIHELGIRYSEWAKANIKRAPAKP